VGTLTLSELPAEVDDFVSLQFTDRGQELFGFGETYLGTFDALGAFDLFISDRRDFDGQEIVGLRGAGEDQGARRLIAIHHRAPYQNLQTYKASR